MLAGCTACTDNLSGTIGSNPTACTDCDTSGNDGDELWTKPDTTCLCSTEGYFKFPGTDSPIASEECLGKFS